MSIIAAQELAARLQGRSYRTELTREEAAAAKAAGLVVVSGYSDDGVTFFGAVDDEAGACNGTELRFTGNGLLRSDCDCEDCPYFSKIRDNAAVIRVHTNVAGYPWSYETSIPHATFDVLDADGLFCRAIVFSLRDVQPAAPSV